MRANKLIVEGNAMLLWGLAILFCVSGVLGLIAVYQIHETYYARLPYLRDYPESLDYLVGFLLSPVAIVLFLQYLICDSRCATA